MPNPASAVESAAFLRLLVLGGPKVGKTYTAITTCEGPAYVINSDDQFSLRPAARVDSTFEWDLALGNDVQTIENHLRSAREGVKAGKYRTIIWDTISMYSQRIVEVYAAASANGKGEPDGRRYWPNYRKHLESIVDRLFALKAHVVVNAHYVEVSSVLIDGQIDKAGQGVVPLLGGQARTTIPAMFQDVVYLEKRGADREFVLSSEGVWGPGCRSLPGVASVPANLRRLWKKMRDVDASPPPKQPAAPSGPKKGP